MGLPLRDLVVKHETSIKELKGKILVVDSHNLLYQFLTTIRGVDGSVFTNDEGKVTSHLIGLFNRVTTLMEEGLLLAFVFDGTPPALKQKTWEKRSNLKKEASLKFKEAQEDSDQENMRKYAMRTVSLTKEMVLQAQELLTYLGLPYLQAPSEGEAQAAYMVKRKDAYASVSQDYDSLIFGCPLLVRNLSLEGKRKMAGTLSYQTIKPELITLSEMLTSLQLTQEQLIVLALLVGTDYNPGGIKGIGPKTALKLVKEFGTNYEALFEKVEWKKHQECGWQELFDTFRNIPVTDTYTLKWNKIQEKEILSFLVTKFHFSEERVKLKLQRLQAVKSLSQTKLGGFL